MNIRRIVVLLIALAPCYIGATRGISDIIGATNTNGQQTIFLGVREEKQEQKKKLEETLKKLQDETKVFEERIGGQLNQVEEARRKSKQALDTSPDDDAVVKKFALLNERFQALKDVERSREQLIETLNDFIKHITEYIDDPDYVRFKKDRKITDSLYSSFDELLRVHEMILNDEARVKQLEDEVKSAKTEQKNRERTLSTIIEDFKKKKEKYGDGTDTPPEIQELFPHEEELFKLKKELAELQIKLSTYRVEALAFEQFVAKIHLGLLKDYLQRIKSTIRIGQTDVTEAKEEIKNIETTHINKKELHNRHIDELEAQQKAQESALESASKQYNIKPGKDLDDWSREPKQTVLSYVGLCKSGLINSSLLLLKGNKELTDANIALENERFSYQRLQADIKETYYKINARRFASEDEVTGQIKEYEALRENLQNSLVSYKEKMRRVADQLNAQKKIVDNINALHKDIDSKRTTLFRSNSQEYALCFDLLRRAERKIRDTIEVLGKLTGVYSATTTNIQASLRIVNFIIAEAQSLITIWYRPSDAISWAGFTNIFSDVGAFVGEISSYVLRFEWHSFIKRMYEAFAVPRILVLLFVKLLIAWLLFLGIYRFAQPVCASILSFALSYKGFIRLVLFLLVLLVQFVYTHIIACFVGLSVYIFMHATVFPDPYLYVVYYLAAIPYLLYIVHRFARFFVAFNEEHDFAILRTDVQRRFVVILSGFAYTTITLMLFRQAFLQINYYQPELYRSELPNIILAVSFIIFQISLMLLISKEQLLNIIPRRNVFTSWIYHQVDRYYYIIFAFTVAVIVMIHPYVGFSRLVIYLVSGLALSTLLIKALLVLHKLFKNGAKQLFFEERDQIVRERFDNAKTWFGLSIIGSFLLFSFVGILIGAKIWGWPITVTSALDWLHEPLLFASDPEPFTVLSLLEVLAFIFGGFLASYAINRFVLDKIFDLLLVDSGVQNMVTRILRYVIIAASVFIGLYSVNLGGLVTWLIAALGLSIGWVLKDPMADIVAYFIILVQRPIKIGDYIKIDENTMGIVRKITPRSVVLRRRNSTTYVVPNSKLITNSIENWNYARNFISFDDIFLTIHYKEDPAVVKDLLARTVHEHPQILRNPKVIVRLTDIGNRGYVFMVRGYLSAAYTLDQWDIASDIRIVLIQKLKEHNIRLALPVMQIEYYDGEKSLRESLDAVASKTDTKQDI